MIPSKARTIDYNPRIVLIDNNDAQLESYSIILSSNNDFQVVGTYSKAEDAIKNLRRDNPDIVFTDLDLVDENSIGVIGKLKKL